MEGCGLGGRGFQAMAHVGRTWRWGPRMAETTGGEERNHRGGIWYRPGLAWWGLVWGMA